MLQRQKSKFCRGDKIIIDLPPNVEVFTPGDLSLQPMAAMSAYDLSRDCTHKVMCCSNVLQALQRFVASCVPTFRAASNRSVVVKFHSDVILSYMTDRMSFWLYLIQV